MQPPVPEQPPPDQPRNAEPSAAAAVKVTWVLSLKADEQVSPQAIPAGAVVTVPLPAPLFWMTSVGWLTTAVPESATLAADFWLESLIVRVADLVPVSAGLKRTPTAQVALAATVCPEQVSDTMEKSPEFVPPSAVVTKVAAVVPLLVTVTV